MHIDYVREQYHTLKNPKHMDPFSDIEFLCQLCTDEFVDHAKEIGDQKIKSICETMQESSGYGLNPRSYKRITRKQQYCVSKFLIEEYSDAKTVISKVYDINVDDVDLTEKEIRYL